jgi:hypothetical protein
MEKLAKATKVRAILISTVAVSLLYYLTPIRLSLYQELFTRFYYIPIVLGGVLSASAKLPSTWSSKMRGRESLKRDWVEFFSPSSRQNLRAPDWAWPSPIGSSKIMGEK